MGNPYPANIQDSAGNVRIAGAVAFTDPDNQPGSGSQTFESVVLPITFETPGLQIAATWLIGAVDQGAKTFTGTFAGSGDGPLSLTTGETIVVFGSTGNDGSYTVVSSLMGGFGQFSAVVAEAIPDATADGNFSQSGPQGIKLCDLAAGDVVIALGSSGAPRIAATFGTVAFDGAAASVYLQLVTTAGRGDMPTTLPTPLIGSVGFDAASEDIAGDGTLLGIAGEIGGSTSDTLIIECAAATSLWIYADDGSTSPPQWPGLTAGSANVRVLIARATT